MNGPEAARRKRLDAMSRAICYWDGYPEQRPGATCRDNFCVGGCQARIVPEMHRIQAEHALAALEKQNAE